MQWYVPCSVNNLSEDLPHYSMKKALLLSGLGGVRGGGGEGESQG